jgi:hypothetical protein
MGSASELDYHLLLASDLGFIESDSYGRLSRSLTEVPKNAGISAFYHGNRGANEIESRG